MTGTRVQADMAITRVTTNKENVMRRQWKMLAIVASVVVVGLAVVGGASAATDAANTQGAADACTALTDNPQALAEKAALRADKQVAWQAWSDKYSADRSSDEAQAAKDQLREKYRSDMTALLEKYGIDVPEGAGPGSRAGAGAGGGMMMGGGTGAHDGTSCTTT
jgi:hypothetical protein